MATDMHRYEEKPKTATLKHKKSQPADLSIEDNFHNSKLMGSINESQDINQRFLETSLNASVSAKNALLRPENKSPNVTYTEIKLAGNSKTPAAVTNSQGTKFSNRESKKSDTLVKKVSEKAAQSSTNTSTSSKPKTSQGERGLKIQSEQKEIYSVSAISTPKNNILSKILKDKPLIKENLYSNKTSKKKEELKYENSFDS
jgi:hypothetical protein